MLTFLKNIVWRDIFKHRYGVVVEAISMAKGFDEAGNLIPGYYYTPAVTRLVVKRPLSMPFHIFYNENSTPTRMFFTGRKSTLRGLYGIGSLSKENLKLAESYYKKRSKDAHADEDLIKLWQNATADIQKL